MTRQRLPAFVGISEANEGARGLSLNLVVIPPGDAAEPHLHRGYETAIYLLEGRGEARYGTEARRSNPVMDLLTNLLPIGWVMTAAQRTLLGTHAFVGKATLEAEAVDAVTGERLLAAVDRRAGRKILSGKFSSWDDVISAYDAWTERIRDRLTNLCQGKEE